MAPLSSNTRYFAGNLRAARMARGLTQTDLGARAGFTQQRISHLERGYRPSRPQVARLARVLNLTVADLLDAPGDPLLTCEVDDAA